MIDEGLQFNISVSGSIFINPCQILIYVDDRGIIAGSCADIRDAPSP